VHRTSIPIICIAAIAILPDALPAQSPQAGEPKSRSFVFTYAGRVTDLKPGDTARVWLPMPVSNGQQEVSGASQHVPGEPQVTKDRQYGNTILYFEGKANGRGEIPFEISYKVLRREVKTDITGNLFVQPVKGEKVERYLEPDAKVPLTGRPQEVLAENLKGKPLPKDAFAAAKAMYDVVNRYMTYKKIGMGWGQGDVLWACDSRYGNCTDFHSLFISMARGNKIPAKFEMGFPLPSARGTGAIPGYHCWAWFMPDGKGWIPVDISEANQHAALADYYFGNLSENRVSFSVGRDIDLEPRQKGPSLNFLIYPYVEVAGQPYAAEKVQRTFSYKDLR
jgi:transglutaminase-like putative cysteine protease